MEANGAVRHPHGIPPFRRPPFLEGFADGVCEYQGPRRLTSRRSAELAPRAGQVLLHGGVGELQFARNLLVRHGPADQAQALPFPFRQTIEVHRCANLSRIGQPSCGAVACKLNAS